MKAAEDAQVMNAVDELVALERRLQESVERATTPPPAIHPEAASVLEAIRATSQRQQTALEAQRQRIGADGPSARVLPVARSLGTVYATLNEIAFAYAVLHTKAHRAFDSQADGNTANLAEAHLRAYSAAIQQLALLTSDVVVHELGSSGNDCLCQCPACGIGVCLCASHGTNTVRQAWQETILPAPEDGLRVRRPRSGSEAERAGLVEGDHVVAIDGHEIKTDLDTSAVQTAIRAHASGDPVRLRVVRKGGEAIELTARRP
jgi:PDZ domain-containing protein